MSNFEVISLIVSVAGSVAVIVTLWFVYRQTRLFAQQTDYISRTLLTGVTQSIGSEVEEITRLFIEYPEMRPYFYKGQSIDETHAHYARAEAIAELLLDSLYSIAEQARRAGTLASTQRPGANWDAYISDIFAQSPILVKFLTERQAWYTEELVELMRRGVQANQSKPAGQAPQPSAG